MRIYGLLPSVHTLSSNGIEVLCQFYRGILGGIDADLRFLVCSQDNQNLKAYREMFGPNLLAYCQEDAASLARSIASEPFALIRPDALEGISNPIHWHLAIASNLVFILNILLAPPFAFATSRPILDSYGEKDHFLIANKAIMPSFNGNEIQDCFFETEVSRGCFSLKVPASLPNRFSVYIGKGVAKPVAGLEEFLRASGIKFSPNCLDYISRSRPQSKTELHRVLLGSALLISFDPFSHIERVATLLGLPVLKPASLNSSELPGVFRSIQELMTVDLLAVRYKLKALAWRDYHQKRTRNVDSINQVLLALRELQDDQQRRSANASIPFTRHLLYAFGSQLRAYLPIMGPIALASLVERMCSCDVFELLSGQCESLNALKYTQHIGASLFASARAAGAAGKEINRKASVIYQYLSDQMLCP